MAVPGVNSCKSVDGPLFVAGRDALVPFEAVQQPLDFFALPAGGLVGGGLVGPVLAGRDHRPGPPLPLPPLPLPLLRRRAGVASIPGRTTRTAAPGLRTRRPAVPRPSRRLRLSRRALADSRRSEQAEGQINRLNLIRRQKPWTTRTRPAAPPRVPET